MYQSAFAHEVPDAAWANDAKRIADGKLPGLLPKGSEVRSFECHSTLCRLETNHRDVASYHLFVRNAFMNTDGHLWNAPTFSGPLDDKLSDSHAVMVSYIAREGHALPRFD
jgi:hypothetical protein